MWEGWRTDIGLAVEERGEEVEVLEGYLLLWWREDEGLASVVRGVKDCIVAVFEVCFRKVGSSRRRLPQGGDI